MHNKEVEERMVWLSIDQGITRASYLEAYNLDLAGGDKKQMSAFSVPFNRYMWITSRLDFKMYY